MMTTRCTSILVLLLAASAAAQAPDGPYWSAYAIPANVTASRLQGSQFVAQTPTAVHLYSGLLRTWTILPVSATAQINMANDYTVVLDGTSFHAYSARTGTVQ